MFNSIFDLVYHCLTSAVSIISTYQPLEFFGYIIMSVLIFRVISKVI